MAQSRKFEQVMAVLERRLREGDYLLKQFPGERRIAQDTGVSYMTARRAVNELLGKEVLVRRSNGALEVHPNYAKRKPQVRVAVLYPAYPSPYLFALRRMVNSALESHQMLARPVQYVHWDDPVVIQAISGAAGTLLIPSTDEIPAWILATMQKNRVVMLDGDCSADKIISTQLFPDAHVRVVFDHLAKLGHRHIDCINTQHRNPEIDRRIDLWRRWRNAHGIEGRLWDEPAASYSDPTPLAHRLASRLIDEKRTTATAIVCTTFPAALGAIRAYWERGRVIGKDISICSINVESPAQFCCPSVTGLDIPNLSRELDRLLDWFSSNAPWTGRTLLAPAKPVLFAGESTGASPK